MATAFREECASAMAELDTGTGYRKDIDGLRAVAVGAVLLFHLGAPKITGGFSGVDVFFVISGYLITGILMRDARSKRLSIAHFYRRRVQRIVPAAALMILASLIAAWVLLPPKNYAALSESAVMSVVGLANIYFFMGSGYFAPDAHSLPLLHMWSLGVEEQFYLAWPMLVLALRTPGKVCIALVLLCSISFMWALWTMLLAPEQAFFLPHLRAWELGLGGLVAFAPKIRPRAIAWVMDVLGVALLAYSFFLISSKDPFPGVNALYPCLGAVLLLWPKSETPVTVTLSIKPVALLGLISYSLYLWHWPIIVFFQVYNYGATPSGPEAVFLALTSILISYMSWKYVELPVRQSRRPNRSAASAITFAAAVSLFGALVVWNSGYSSRLPEGARQIASYRFETPENIERMCSVRDDGERCFNGPERATVLILGDSHAGHLLPGLSAVFPAINFAEAYSSGCRPVLGSRGRAECVELMTKSLEDFVPIARLNAVIIAARWRNGDVDRLAETVRYLEKYVQKVIVVGQTMEYSSSLPDLIVGASLPRGAAWHWQDNSLMPQMQAINGAVQSAIAGTAAEFINPIEYLCPSGECTLEPLHGVPMQHDYGHLTPEASIALIDQLRNRLAIDQ